jgi:hypothetical protein
MSISLMARKSNGQFMSQKAFIGSMVLSAGGLVASVVAQHLVGKGVEALEKYIAEKKSEKAHAEYKADQSNVISL